MRIKETVTDIDYGETRQFFESRARKYSESNPYSVTMYQDNNEELVRKRNAKEVEKLYPYLGICKTSRILDVACGIGRWADALPEDVEEYCGVDFSHELIKIAIERNKKKKFYFLEGAATDIDFILKEKNKEKFNTILMIGIQIYLNDGDLLSVLEQVEQNCELKAKICIREPVGVRTRLTLKDYFSEELKDFYNVVYRTKEELVSFLSKAFLDRGFSIKKEGFLFDEDALNNRKETVQYYYILER